MEQSRWLKPRASPQHQKVNTILFGNVEIQGASNWFVDFAPIHQINIPWWRHQMETFSALLALCAGNSPVTGEFPAQRPVTRSFDVFFDLRPNKRLSKQSWGWWFETPFGSLWRHCNGSRIDLKRSSNLVMLHRYSWNCIWLLLYLLSLETGQRQKHVVFKFGYVTCYLFSCERQRIVQFKCEILNLVLSYPILSHFILSCCRWTFRWPTRAGSMTRPLLLATSTHITWRSNTRWNDDWPWRAFQYVPTSVVFKTKPIFHDRDLWKLAGPCKRLCSLSPPYQEILYSYYPIENHVGWTSNLLISKSVAHLQLEHVCLVPLQGASPE